MKLVRLAAGVKLRNPGLRADALGFAESVIMGIAGSGPAYSVAASTATLVGAVSVLAPASVLYCGLIMFGIVFAFRHLNPVAVNAGAPTRRPLTRGDARESELRARGDGAAHDGLGFSWADVTATQVYTIFEIHPLMADEFARRGAMSVLVAVDEREAQIEPNGVLDDNRREAVAAVGDFSHPTSLPRNRAPDRYPYNTSKSPR